MKLEIIQKGKNRLRLQTKSVVLDNHINAYFTVPNKNARHSAYASPTSSPITPLGSFKAGIIQEILDYVHDKFPEVEIDTSQVDKIIHPFYIKIDKLHDLANTEDFETRAYQDEAVQLALQHGRGTFEMATSAGKSYIITKLIYNIWKTTTKKKTLILVPTIQLVTQFYKEIIEYGIDKESVCMFSRKCPEAPQGDIIISNIQWLNRHSKELPKDIEMTIIDEAHMLKGTNKVCKLVESMPLIRFAFTGTLPEDHMDRWNVIGIAGPLLKVTKAKELQQEGYIANIDIVALYLKHGVAQPHKPASEVLEEYPEYRGNSEKIALEIAKARFPLEWRYIEESEKANNFLCRLSLKLVGNNIILFDHIAHGKVIQEKLQAMTDRPIFFIDGSVKLEIREDICEAMENQSGCILVANCKAFGTGTNVKAINNIIFGFSAGNSATKVIQGIGRGLRVKEGKTKMTLYDVYHSFRYSTEHYEKRKGLYKDNYDIKSFKKITVNL